MPTTNSASIRASEKAFDSKLKKIERAGFRGDLRLAVAVFAAAFVVFHISLVPYALPGENAHLLATAAGLKADFASRYWLWRSFMRLVAAVAPVSKLSLFANTVCAAVSAFAVSALFLALSRFVSMSADAEHWESAFGADGEKRVVFMSRAAGLAAAAVLATSAPFWSSAAQVRPETFHLAWLLVSAVALMRFCVTGSSGWLATFAVLHGAGRSQASCFVAWAPLFWGAAAWSLWTRDRLTPARASIFAGIGLASFLLFFWLSAHAFWVSPACAVYGAEKEFADVAQRIARDLVSGVMSAFGRAWWLILLGLAVLPWLSAVVVSRRALNGDGGIAMYLLHVAIGVTTLCVIADFRFSPWQLSRGEYQIVPYAMTALSAGYLVAWLLSEAAHDNLPGDPKRATLRSWISVGVAGVIAAAAACHNVDDACLRGIRFPKSWTDLALDGLQGRDWLFTDGAMDANLLIRARERGIPLHVVNLAQPSGLRATADFRDALPDVRLRNVSEIGLVPMLREWLANRKDASERVALAILPDFWHLGPWADYPSGFFFLGAAPADVDKLVSSGYDGGTMESFSAMEADFSPGEKALPQLRYLAEHLLHRASLAGNNLGFLLETHGRDEEAFGIYDYVSHFDPDNVSAVLNWVSLIRGGLHPELADEATAALDKLRTARADRNDNIWTLASACGYVSSPVAFANLGWTWALSGQPTLALNSLNRALRDVHPVDQSRLHSALAGLYLQGGDLEKSEFAYRKVLEEDPGSPQAIIGLVRIAVMRGDFSEARRRLESALAAGIAPERVLFETGAIELASGDPGKARVIARRIIELDPESVEARSLLAAVPLQEYSEAASGPAGDGMRAAALDELSAVVDDLSALAGPENVRTLSTRARLRELQERYAEAREDWTDVLRVTPEQDSLPVRESILRLDFALMDKVNAARHARDVLARSPGHSFANYILGSLAIERDKLESAEDYLQRALDGAPDSVPALNDLADVKFQLRKYDEAEALVMRMFRSGLEIYNAWDTLASVRLAKGDVAGAREAIDKALSLDTGHDPRVSLHLVQILAAQGETSRATGVMRELFSRRDEFRGSDARDFAAVAARLRVTE